MERKKQEGKTAGRRPALGIANIEYQTVNEEVFFELGLILEEGVRSS